MRCFYEKNSIHNLYWFALISYTFTLICVLVTASCLPIFLFEKFTSYSVVLWIVFVVAVAILCVLFIIYCIKKIFSLLKDFKSLKSKEYISFIGKVIRFEINKDSETGVQINNTPVVVNIETNEEIELTVNDFIDIGGVYRFNYLENSKIAEIVEKIS